MIFSGWFHPKTILLKLRMWFWLSLNAILKVKAGFGTFLINIFRFLMKNYNRKREKKSRPPATPKRPNSLSNFSMWKVFRRETKCPSVQKPDFKEESGRVSSQCKNENDFRSSGTTHNKQTLNTESFKAEQENCQSNAQSSMQEALLPQGCVSSFGMVPECWCGVLWWVSAVWNLATEATNVITSRIRIFKLIKIQLP